MDDDLADMNREQLAADVRKLRDAIRRHRDSSGHALCWHHPDMWNLLPERTDQQPPGRNSCTVARYRESLDRQLPDAPRDDAPYTQP